MIIRIISSLIGLPLVLAILILGTPSVVYSFFVVIHFLLALEIMRIYVEDPQRGTQSFLGFARGDWMRALASTLAFIVLLLSEPEGLLARLSFFLCGVALLSALLPGTIEQRSRSSQSTVLGMVYSLIPWLMIASLYEKAENERFVILLLSIAWAGDTAAYFVGKTWGRRPMAPMISPKKTWLGACAGFVASALAAWIVSAIYDNELGDPAFMIGVGAVCALFGQMGDLFKSVFKRQRGVKDSGRLMPGHGGLLDRMDGALMAAPVLNLFF
ncbi:phosphatidate cytidylyltransferase [Oligoflexus tunisiensis]|uniref:phosphatidate cytidylyltransferase n=1 Tax=Oligoflexus tunisiensis TaxID=708132 RepID=UPI000B0C59DD|nr:phosphatidate cytidylyltransferase [Oligoflexus tunisiensis]